MTIVLATQNPGKIAEIIELLPPHWSVSTAQEHGITEEIPETGSTLEANAEQKARYIYERIGLPALADDTGLEIDALNGAPGVYSARYAGEEKNNQKNMDKVLRELGDATNRSARFRTVMALVDDKGVRFFKGVVNGHIAHERLNGKHGFGYDPIFIPDTHSRSFAQMSGEEKSSISHRGNAIREFGKYMTEQDQNIQ
jgi:XTP/dITP diphosphohydrolase